MIVKFKNGEDNWNFIESHSSMSIHKENLSTLRNLPVIDSKEYTSEYGKFIDILRKIERQPYNINGVIPTDYIGLDNNDKYYIETIPYCFVIIIDNKTGYIVNSDIYIMNDSGKTIEKYKM